MKLYMKQKVFSWRERFTVKDEEGTDRYIAEGEAFSWGHRLHVFDSSQKEVIYIQQERIFSWKPRYDIYIDGREAAQVVKELTFLRPQYTISGCGWEVNGSFWAHEYDIMEKGNRIVSVKKEWMTWGDSYEVDVKRPEDELMALAVTLTIDCVMASAEAHGA